MDSSADAAPQTVAAGADYLGHLGQLHADLANARAEADRLARDLAIERHAALHDSLTGLHNRRAFYEIGTELLADPADRPILCALIGLDGFRLVNEALGHASGDDVLITIAARLTGYAGHHLVARLGGDEFALLLRGPAGDPEWAMTSASALTNLFATPIWVGGNELTVSASVGLAMATPPARLREVLGHADSALYRAKQDRPRSHSPAPHTGQAVWFDARIDDDITVRAHVRPAVRTRDLDRTPGATAAIWRRRQPSDQPGRLSAATRRAQTGRW